MDLLGMGLDRLNDRLARTKVGDSSLPRLANTDKHDEEDAGTKLSTGCSRDAIFALECGFVSFIDSTLDCRSLGNESVWNGTQSENWTGDDGGGNGEDEGKSDNDRGLPSSCKTEELESTSGTGNGPENQTFQIIDFVEDISARAYE